LPLEAVDLTDLVMGFMELIVNLNADCLAAGFQAKGLGIEIATPPESAEVFLHATNRIGARELTVQVSARSCASSCSTSS
jgi:hypothetical protein